MSEPTRIVLGIVEQPLERDQEAKVITLAAAALAAVAAVGNRDQISLMAVLTAAAKTYQSLSPEAQGVLTTIADELVASARAGKPFIAFAEFRRPS